MEESEPTAGQACSTSSESANSLLFLNSLMGSLGQTTCGQGAMSHLVNLSSSTDLVATCRQSISLPHSCGRSKRCGSTIQFDKNAVIRSLFTIFGNIINKDWCPASSQVPQELRQFIQKHWNLLVSSSFWDLSAPHELLEIDYTLPNMTRCHPRSRSWYDGIRIPQTSAPLSSNFCKEECQPWVMQHCAKLKWSVEKSWCRFHQVHQH